jgi:hypothetical protein
MYATIGRYEGVDASRTDELSRKVAEGLLPRLNELPGFGGYYLIEAGNGVMTSVSLFETSAQADESTHLVVDWVQEEELQKALPKPPKITSGEVVARTMDRAVAAV